MKLLALMFLFFTASIETGYADTPEAVTIKSRKGNILFLHRQHEERGHLKDCTICHSKEAGFKLGKQGMATGHTMCRACHTEADKGPRICDDCHK